MSAAQSGELATELFELPGGGFATFTGRAQGNMSSVGGDGSEHGLKAREQLRETLGVRRLVRGYQVHGTVVGRVLADDERIGLGSEALEHPGVSNAFAYEDSLHQPTFEADGHALASPGLAAMVLTADCIPVALGAQGAVAALHAGWRGLAAGVLQEGAELCARLAGGEK